MQLGKLLIFLEIFAVSHVNSRMLQLEMLFISKPFSVLWIESQMGRLDKVCFFPEFNTLVQTLDKSLPLSSMQQPQRARREFRDKMLQE